MSFVPFGDIMDSKFEKLTTNLDGFMDVMGTGNSHFEKKLSIAIGQVMDIEQQNEIPNEQVNMMCRNSTFQYT